MPDTTSESTEVGGHVHLYTWMCSRCRNDRDAHVPMTHTRKNRSPIGVVAALEVVLNGTPVASGSAAELSTSRVTKKRPCGQYRQESPGGERVCRRMKSVADKSQVAIAERKHFARRQRQRMSPFHSNTPLCLDMLQQHTQKPRIQAEYHTNLIYFPGYWVNAKA